MGPSDHVVGPMHPLAHSQVQALGSYTYAARLSASSCRSQLNNGFELVKIWSTTLRSPAFMSELRGGKPPFARFRSGSSSSEFTALTGEGCPPSRRQASAQAAKVDCRCADRATDSTPTFSANLRLGLGKKASPSVGALVNTLSHGDPYVRIYAAEALASIGPNAAKATNALAEALADPIPGVRWAACEALASIGPAAQSAVPQLIEALEDEFLYVRIFAAGALGSIGPKAQSAREALREAANDPAMRDEVEWALSRIEGSQLINGANEFLSGST